jgi:Subtilase family
MAGVLLKVSGDGEDFTAAAKTTFAAQRVKAEPILRLPAPAVRLGMAPRQGSTWLRISSPSPSENLWDDAHDLHARSAPFAAAGVGKVQAVEPDREQQWGWSPQPASQAQMAASAADRCAVEDQNEDGGKAEGPGPAWTLGDSYSQLKKARDAVDAKQGKILIAHLDTGYDPDHLTRPLKLRADLQRNFIDGQDPADAVDQVPPGMELIRNRGHGTGTLSLLAGNRLDGTTSGFPGFRDWLGGAPQAQIIPVRIADWVVRFTTGTMVQGIQWACDKGAHVLSMSMGGLSSQALADAVNLAYDSGLVMVTAAGNNFAWLPSPKTVVFPARFKRVLAACGVMADGRAYADLAFGTMQGNYGPPEKMDTALGAYTPNTPWAKIACGKIVDMDGAGTSAATPQIAAAAALWLAHYWDIVSGYPEPWMRVEAVRKALFDSASRTTARMNADETREKVGRGVMQAAAALAVRPSAAVQLTKLQPSEESWPWLNLLFGSGGVTFAAQGAAGARARMFALELTQMAQSSPQVEATILAPESDPADISAAARNRYLEAALDSGNPSKPLRAFLEKHLGRGVGARPPPPAGALDSSPGGPPFVSPPDAGSAPAGLRKLKRKFVEPEPPKRRLRVFALDPSIAKRLETMAINEAVIEVPWDDNKTTGEALKPGPVGEYLEVIDVDPASGKVYDPVDLNDKLLLAQDGLQPSEGNPKFHQQMVYAVAMKTISHFEEALGRKALWAPRLTEDSKGKTQVFEVRRLRIYPHALRMANAYYSPEKKALLLGYFPAGNSANDSSAPGNMVFSCLSSDIVAHEMTHALLDGLHRRFQEASNLDVPAFHEAFADIVAVFQHFTIPELVRFEIERQHGDLGAANLLSGLAEQFGEGSGIGHVLRDYGKDAADDKRYETTCKPHDRGQILVLAIYDAFLAIVARRTADLIRIATGGSGVLPHGALHPDLVNRLADETCKSARHVLRMCIRALDYCPSVDITFGEYLRALITADFDLVPDDDLGYRTAFIEAFRKRGIPVRDVRTLSTESLTWDAPKDDRPDWLKNILEKVQFGLDRKRDRSQIFKINNENCKNVWRVLNDAFTKDPNLCRQFGLMPNVPHYDKIGNIKPKAEHGSTNFDVFSVRPARRIAPDGEYRPDIVAVITQRRPILYDSTDPGKGFFWFRGGATLILDPHDGDPRIRYSVIKNSDSKNRLAIQFGMATGAHMTPLQALYFGSAKFEPFAMMHAGHRN